MGTQGEAAGGLRACPACGERLVTVSADHVRRHLRRPWRRPGIPAGEAFGWCPSPGCRVAYVSAAGQVVPVRRLRRAPADKAHRPTAPLCYCFDVSGADVVGPDGEGAVAFIREQVRAGACACDVLNPSGGCCLGAIGRYRLAAQAAG